MQLDKCIIFRGPIVNPYSDSHCELHMDGCLILQQFGSGEDYRVDNIGPWNELEHQLPNEGNFQIRKTGHQVILPSFFDLHFHWVQDEVRQKPKKDLLAWLKEFTWPHEARFGDESYSKQKSAQFADYLLQCGTLGGIGYGSPHPHTVDHALSAFTGDFVIGNALMTMNSPSYLVQSPNRTLQTVLTLSEKYRHRYALTPRLAPVVDPDIMSQAVRTIMRNDGFIQTHLSETKDEVQWALDVFRKHPGFEKVASYTEIYDRCRILQSKSVLAHCIYLNSDELQLIAKRGSAIAHCPSSNAPVVQDGLGSGLFDFRTADALGIPWALGSDVGGGPWLSMLDVIQSFVSQNRDHGFNDATYVKGLYRATLKAAEILDTSNTCGNLQKGKWANFVLAPLPKTAESAETLLESLIAPLANTREKYDQLVDATYYRGRLVYQKSAP